MHLAFHTVEGPCARLRPNGQTRDAVTGPRRLIDCADPVDCATLVWTAVAQGHRIDPRRVTCRGRPLHACPDLFNLGVPLSFNAFQKDASDDALDESAFGRRSTFRHGHTEPEMYAVDTDPDAPPEGDRWSSWDGATHGPKPSPTGHHRPRRGGVGPRGAQDRQGGRRPPREAVGSARRNAT